MDEQDAGYPEFEQCSHNRMFRSSRSFFKTSAWRDALCSHLPLFLTKAQELLGRHKLWIAGQAQGFIVSVRRRASPDCRSILLADLLYSANTAEGTAASVAASSQLPGQRAAVLWAHNDCVRVQIRIRKRETRSGRTGNFSNARLPQTEGWATPLLELPKAVVASSESVTFKTEEASTDAEQDLLLSEFYSPPQHLQSTHLTLACPEHLQPRAT